ncbi:MAG: glycosyltransferase family 4 protein [Patescibacteria group bacterium]|jgi:glycosyltransferase involved in cell wall biosynthesis
MKKVLIFVPEFPRLTETFIEREISKLVSLGDLDITVFSLKKATGALSSNLSERVVYRTPGVIDALMGIFHFAFSHPGRVVRALALIYGKDKMNIFARKAYFLKAFGYARLFGEYSPDHIHAHFLSWPSTIAMVSATLMDVPYSISAHARDVMVDGTLVPAKVKTAKFISICNKFAWRSCIDQSGLKNPQNVYQQYHGVDVSKLPVDSKTIDPTRKPYILVVSRLVEKKGLVYIIEASKILKDRGIEHEVHIAGPGPLYEELMGKIKQLGVVDTVFMHGDGKGLSWNEIVEQYKITDIFALPSINTGAGDADGVPNVVIEASLCKIPVVTTDAGSITDLIEHEKTGLLVKQADSEDLANALERLISDKELRKTLGENAHQKAREMFDLNRNTSELQKLFFK